jgi:hypothetical protein
MAGDFFQRSTTGQKFAGVPSRLDNILKEVARSSQADGLLSATSGGKSHEGLIYVLNNSGSQVNRFGVLGISGVIVDDTQNLATFQNNWALAGTTPDDPEHRGKFVIAWEPIASGAIGRAFVFGTCPVQLTINNSTDNWADIVDGDATHLQSGPTGGVQILYVGDPDDDGLCWAIVRFGFGFNVYACPQQSGSGS